MLKIKGTFLDSKVARRMFLLFIVSALLPIIILAFFSVRQVSTLTTTSIEEDLRQDAKSYGLSIYDHLTLLNEKLILYSGDSLIPTHRKNSDFTQIYTFTSNDINFLKDNNLPALSIADYTFLQQGHPVLATQFQEDHPAQIYLFHAIDGTDHIIAGLIKGEALWGQAETFDETRGFCIYGAENKKLFCSQLRLDNQLQSIKSKWDKATSGNVTLNSDKETLLVGFWSLFLKPRFLYPNFTIAITYDQSRALAPISGLRNIFIIVSLLTLIIIAFFSTIQIRRYLTPLEELMRGIQRISNNDFNHPVTVKTDDEFNQLAESFNSMSKRLSQQFEFLTTMAEIDQHILSSTSIKNIISTIIKQGNKATQSETLNIAMFNEHSNDMIDIFSVDFHHIHGTSVTSHHIQKNDTNSLIDKKTAIYSIDDIYLPPCLKSLIRPSVSQFVVVPVLLNKTLAAILIFGFREQEFSQETLFRLRELGDRFAIALEKLDWEKKLYQQAHYDPLTQLPNRQLLNERLQQAIKRSVRDKSCFSLMFIDLDRFKTVNDSLGHSSGDQLLKIVSQRLLNTLRDDDTVARLGGDEFILFLSPIDNCNELYSRSALIANNVLSAISKSYNIDDQEIHISASIGITSFPTDGQDVETLIKNADSAMYHAKKHGRNNFQFYSKSLNEKALQHLVMETELHHAIENDEFEIFYQPKVETQSGKILGAEALIRWNHPEKGLLTPYHFISIAEETGLIKKGLS